MLVDDDEEGGGAEGEGIAAMLLAPRCVAWHDFCWEKHVAWTTFIPYFSSCHFRSPLPKTKAKDPAWRPSYLLILSLHPFIPPKKNKPTSVEAIVRAADKQLHRVSGGGSKADHSAKTKSVRWREGGREGGKAFL